MAVDYLLEDVLHNNNNKNNMRLYQQRTTFIVSMFSPCISISIETDCFTDYVSSSTFCETGEAPLDTLGTQKALVGVQDRSRLHSLRHLITDVLVDATKKESTRCIIYTAGQGRQR